MWPEIHQGAGLLGFAAGQGPRLLPVLSHPEAAMELEVLWQLAVQLQQQGYPVLVLDATADEQAGEPGLAPWLARQASPRPDNAGMPTVVPAARGVAQLMAWTAAAALQGLADVVSQFAAVLLYAPAPAVAALVRDQAVTPLVIAAPGEAALLRSYSLLKQMAACSPLPCTVAVVLAPGGRRDGGERVLQALRQGSAQWFGASPRGVVVSAGDEAALGALALQLLENACTMAGPAACATPAYHPGATHYHPSPTH